MELFQAAQTYAAELECCVNGRILHWTHKKENFVKALSDICSDATLIGRREQWRQWWTGLTSYHSGICNQISYRSFVDRPVSAGLMFCVVFPISNIKTSFRGNENLNGEWFFLKLFRKLPKRLEYCQRGLESHFSSIDIWSISVASLVSHPSTESPKKKKKTSEGIYPFSFLQSQLRL